MKSSRQYIWMATVVAMLFAVGCHREEVIDDNEDRTSELKFTPSLGESLTAETRAGESDNSVLQTASKAGNANPHIAIDTYTGTPGSTLEKSFTDELGYFEASKSWGVNSGIPRFLPSGGMNLYAYFATKFTNEADLTAVKYTASNTGKEYPKLNFTVAADGDNQVDLIAAKVENIKSPNISIPMRHILSQINFGVRGIDQHQISIKNIRINNIKNSGLFDYDTWGWTANSNTTSYSYYFPDRQQGVANSGLGDGYTTQGVIGDSQNSYIFGDGGKFGPGKDEKFLYAQVAPGYATKEKTPNPLHNSLMLMPQQIMDNVDATVTFDFEIQLDGVTVRSGKDNIARLDAYHNWLPNLRYVYIFNFDETDKVTFDVLVEPWEYFNDTDGIVDSEELTPLTLFDKYIRPLKSSGAYSAPLGPLSSDFLCDWSLYSMDNSFLQSNQFTVSFSSLPFTRGKAIIIKPPFGFSASHTSLSAEGSVTFTAIRPYYTTVAQVNAAVSSGSGNYEFSVSSAIKLEDIKFDGSTTAESSLTLHYLNTYSGTTSGRWQLYDDNKTAILFPQDLAVTGGGGVPYSYTLYNIQGLTSVLDWMTGGGANPGGSDSSLDYAARMKTNITLSPIGRYNLADSYKSSADDPKTKLYVPLGTSAAPYVGVFDGRGATVENLYISDFGDGNQGLFRFIGYLSHVKFINLKNAYVYSGGYAVGGLVGQSQQGATITGCSVSGTIHGGYTGGIVGENSGIVYSCASSAAITSYNGAAFTGGIAGVDFNTIQGCYSNSSNLNITGNFMGFSKTNFYVATNDVGSVTGSIRVPSIAALNGKIPQLNSEGAALFTGAHFISGNLNDTPPTIATGNPDGRLNGGVLRGTFIQNWFSLYWDKNRWDAEMAILATLGMEYLVIDQVMEFSDYLGNNQYMSWYPATKSVLVNNSDYLINVNAADPALIKCMNACKKHGIKLFIGTFFDSRYWNAGAAVTNPTQWTNCITTSNNIMAELTKFYFNGASSTVGDYTDLLAGWYFPYEVDDLFFKTGVAQTLLKNGISSAIACRDGLVNAAARKPYLFSPFMNGDGPGAEKNTMTSTQYATLWRDIIANAGFRPGDILSPQDCIGVGKLTIAELHDWMPKLRDATNKATTGVEFWINIETFGPGANISFLTQQQIMTSKQYASKLISFSYPIYYSPESDRRQGDHNAYKRYYDAQ